MAVLLFQFSAILLAVSVSDGSFFEKNLLKDLFKDYNKDARPVLTDSDVVNVTIGLSLSQIIDVHEKHQIMTTSVWTRQKWYNPYLTWNKTAYGNITAVNVPSSNVWLPDLVLYNNADESIGFRGNLDRLSTRVQLSYNGENNWLAPVMLRSKCHINVKYFPFDTQNCTMKFGSWTYDGLRLDVQKETDTVDVAKYVQSGEWYLAEAPVRRNVQKYFCCPEPYPDVTFSFIMKRRTLFYLFNLILPLVLISVLITFVFTLPPESGERITLSITILLAMTVFMLLVSESMPPTSEVVPLIGKFYMAVMVEMALALIVTCYVIRCHHTTSKNRVPAYVKKYLVGKLANFFGIKKSDELLKEEREESLRRSDKQDVLLKKMVGNNNADKWEDRDNEENQRKTRTVGDSVAEKMLEKLEIISHDVVIKGEEELVKEQWHVLAKVIDRLALCSFAVMIVITMIAIFSQSPGYVS